MSKIGKKPIDIPEGVSVEIKDNKIEVKGKNATLGVAKLAGVSVEKKENQIVFLPKNGEKQTISNWGTLRALVQNAIEGALENFTKQLIIEGVGYRASMEGQELVLGLGYSHQIRFSTPEGVSIEVSKNTITISGADKALVGEIAAKIRSFRKPEPYKGKGIRYSDEIVKRKAGKKAVSAGGA
jgi:large subunit ribosomal protein L6